MAEIFNTYLLPVGLGIIMLGLGLTLTVADFSRVMRQPKAAVVALACQIILMPAVCFGLVVLFQVPPVLAVGMMLVAAAPGGATANLFSYVFGGDVALNVSLTAVNSVLAVFTIPLITNLATAFFLEGDAAVGLQLAKVLEIFLIVIGPVAVGMVARWIWPRWAQSMGKTVRVASIVILVLLIAGVLSLTWSTFLASFGVLAGITTVFSLASFTVGFLVPRLFRVTGRQAVSTSYEIGIHNLGISIFIAAVVLDTPAMALPSAVYLVPMNIIALLFGLTVARHVAKRATQREAADQAVDASPPAGNAA